MTIRVTLGMLNNQFVQNLNSNLLRTAKLQNELATGKILNAPSDDPVGITFSMRYRNEIAGNEQYQENLQTAVSFLQNVDASLNQATSLIQRARELTVQALNDTNDKSSRSAIALEIDQLLDEFVNVANTSFNGKYIFSGQTVDIKPYDKLVEEPRNTLTDPAEIQFEVAAGVLMPVNLTGNSVFGNPTDTDNVFGILEDLAKAMREEKQPVMDGLLKQIDTRMDKILGARAIVGSRENRLEFIDTRLTDIELNLTKLQSDVEDANMAELITQMKANESVYQASLATGAKIIQQTLIDFLR